jgi:PAS domain S-box-containing protein
MEASLAFLNHVYKNAAVGLCYFDTQLRYCHINEWLAAFNGLPVEAHLGRAVHEVVPDVAAEIEAQLRHVIETGEPLIEGVVETETPAHPGVRKTFLHSFHAVKADDGTVSGVSCFVQDISEHKKAEATLRERQEQFNRALEGSNDGFWDWPDLTKDEEWWSDRWFELVGLEPGEIEPSYTNFQALLHPDDLPRMAAAVALHFEKRVPFDVEYRLQHKNGEYRWFRGRGQAAWDESGTPICMSGSIHDLSEHKKAEESMQNIQRLESLGVMAGGIAHDFNNFLTAILGNLSLAKCDPDAGSELRELIEESENACTLAKSLAQQFLTFAAGGTPILRPSSLEPLLTEAATLASRGSTSRLVFDIEKNLRPAKVDRQQLVQVLHNLVLNAVQAMAEGGVLTVAASNIEINEKEMPPLAAGSYVKVRVKDEGVGIPGHQLARIFDPYFSTKKEGRGLGLATCFSIMAKHGGHIGVESQPGVGTTVAIYLPVACSMEMPAAKAARIRTGRGRVLIMDDEPMILTTISRILRKLGYEAESVSDGVAALNVYKNARASGARFATVILDLTIPGSIGGQETAKRLKEIDPTAKVIVSSGYSSDPIMSHFAEHGFAAALPKPYKMDEVSEVLNGVIGLAPDSN